MVLTKSSNPKGTPGASSMDSPSVFFTVRLWRESQGGGEYEWRGLVQHVLSERYRYFHDWQTLEDFLAEICSAPTWQEESRDG